ncbi:(ZYRO0D02310g) [Zygosaccharomyces parabailii]|nr:(ZYRO0D02310g) [Zygosaccharomyces parabailii]CDH09277.1 uncharacterized protein ZBAI_01061 [Zygosaccharomyces bailii ISA1307]
MLHRLIIVIFTLIFTHALPLISHNTALPQYSLIATLQNRVANSDAPDIVKALHKHVLSFSALPRTTLPHQFNEFSLSVEHNLVTAVFMNETCHLELLEVFTRFKNAGEEITTSISQMNRISSVYWTLAVPLQLTLKSSIAYRCWQLQRWQQTAIQSANATALLQDTFSIVYDSTILLEASTYMLHQLHKLGSHELHRICEPILSHAFGSLFNQLPQDSLDTLVSQLRVMLSDDTSRHRYSELALGSLLLVLLATSSLLLLPLMCHERAKFAMLTRCFLYIVGVTWFHMMVFFLYFCKLRKDFEI